MPGRILKKSTTVHEHPLHVPPSKKNPDGITIRKQHSRRVYTSYSAEDLKEINQRYQTKGITFPTENSLKYPDGNRYDKLIAIWVDYFNKKLPPVSPYAPLDPNIIKALIASESGFESNPQNPKAFGITQITPATLKTLKDPKGEVKDFLFPTIKRSDLLDPSIAIPMGVRWIFYKKQFAEQKLKRPASTEEIILAYKGLLESKSDFKQTALEVFRKKHASLQKK
jgi:hypothetical protein